MTAYAYDAIVLAGGAARRLGGADKPGVRVGGRALLDRVLEACAGAVTTVVVAEERRTARPVVWAREEPPGGGPLAALEAGVRRLARTPDDRAAPTVLVLSADLPFLREHTVRALLDALADSRADAALLTDADGRDQPLVAAYRHSALHRTLTELAAEQAAQAPRAGQAGHAEQASRAMRAGQAGHAEQASRARPPERVEQARQAEQPEQAPRAPQARPPERAELAAQAEQIARAPQAQQIARAAQARPPRSADQPPQPGEQAVSSAPSALAGLPLRLLTRKLKLTRVTDPVASFDCDTWGDIAAARSRIREHGRVLDEWITAAKNELGIDLDVDTAVLLDLARDAAHGVARPAAPLTTFLVGYAAAQAGGGPEAVASAAAKAAELANRWAQEADSASQADARPGDAASPDAG